MMSQDVRTLRVAEDHVLGGANPYLSLLADAARPYGAVIERFDARRLFRGQIDVWHLHWPEAIARRSSLRNALTALGRLCAYLLVAKVRKVAVVWTVHNSRGHEVPRPRLDQFVRHRAASGIDGWIALSEAAAIEAMADNPRLADKPYWVIPHGHYRSAYAAPPPRGEARRRYAIADGEKLILFFGLIRPYKNVPALLEAFRLVEDPTWHLIVAGRALAEDEHELHRAAEADRRVQLRLGHIADEEVPWLFAASDLVVLPFKRCLNSGSAILGLSFDRPVLVPRLGSMPALAEQVGQAWVQLFEEPLQARHLEESVRRTVELGGPAPLDALEWEAIGRNTVDAYRLLLGSPEPSAPRGTRL